MTSVYPQIYLQEIQRQFHHNTLSELLFWAHSRITYHYNSKSDPARVVLGNSILSQILIQDGAPTAIDAIHQPEN